MKATYITHMGDDLLVVNAARVSFKKKSVWETDEQDLMTGQYDIRLRDRDKKLLSYLASHNHWTPFAHPQICMHIKAPIFVARQLFKHKVGMVENEVSRRYVDEEPEYYTPEVWRGRPKDKKQGSEGTIDPNNFGTAFMVIGENTIPHAERRFHEGATDYYQSLLDHGVAPEQARKVLPQDMYTEWYWTGSLASWARIYKQRTHEDAQQETRELVEQMGEIIAPLFPVSWEVLTN